MINKQNIDRFLDKQCFKNPIVLKENALFLYTQIVRINIHM